MLQFLSPFALIALSALAIPVVLHLWRPPPRTVRLGTLRFFSGPAVRRLTKLRWREHLLLLVRLLLVALLAFVLAQPLWKKAAPTGPQRWAVVEPGFEVREDALRRLHDLRDQGFEIRELAGGFRKVPPSQRVSAGPDPQDVWSLLREVDARLPVGSTVAVFASNRLSTLSGERPVMHHCTVEWISSEAEEVAPAIWISSAEAANDGKIRVTIGRSNAALTDRVVVSVERRPAVTALAPPLDGWSVEISDTATGDASARLVREPERAKPGESMPVAQPIGLRVAIVHAPDRTEDARYVRAAVEAIGEVSGREIDVNSTAESADCIFWLNDLAPPPDILNQIATSGATLLSDAESSREKAVSVITAIEAEPLDDGVALFRRVAPSQSGVAVWRDGFGTPLLSLGHQGRGRHFWWLSRFHPEWNDLPRNSALAAALRPLLLADTADSRRDRQHDQRRADVAQARPSDPVEPRPRPDFRVDAPAELIDLHDAMWLGCVALFLLERFLSHNNARRRQAERAPSAREEPALVEHA